MKVKDGAITLPVIKTHFGDVVDLTSKIPADCDCIMVLINSGSGLNAGFPQPVGFIKLPHQLYLEDIHRLMIEQCNKDGLGVRPPRWITVVPVRSKEYVDVWSAEGNGGAA